MGQRDFRRALLGQPVNGAPASGGGCCEIPGNQARAPQFCKADIRTADGMKSGQLLNLPTVKKTQESKVPK
jgi:hypothetical protein